MLINISNAIPTRSHFVWGLEQVVNKVVVVASEVESYICRSKLARQLPIASVLMCKHIGICICSCVCICVNHVIRTRCRFSETDSLLAYSLIWQSCIHLEFLPLLIKRQENNIRIMFLSIICFVNKSLNSVSMLATTKTNKQTIGITAHKHWNWLSRLLFLMCTAAQPGSSDTDTDTTTDTDTYTNTKSYSQIHIHTNCILCDYVSISVSRLAVGSWIHTYYKTMMS